MDGALTQGMAPDLSLLHGEVLVNKTQLEGFSAASLPARPAQRFAALFARRQQWAADDLKPYIASLEVSRCTCSASTIGTALLLPYEGQPMMPGLCLLLQAPGQSTEALLLRYTRATQPHADSTIVYSAR